MQDSIRKAYETAENSFVCVDDEEREQLQKFAFICNLSFDVYVKKQLIEKSGGRNFQKPDKKKLKALAFLKKNKKWNGFQILKFVPFCYYVFGNSCYYQLLPMSVKLRFRFFSPRLKSLKYHIVSIITIIKRAVYAADCCCGSTSLFCNLQVCFLIT